MANIRVDVTHPIVDGEMITFKAPCACTSVTGIKVYYPEITDSAATTKNMTFTMKDCHGNDLTGVADLFASGAYITAILNTTNKIAYLQNADTNKYLESKRSALTTRVSTLETKATTFTSDITSLKSTDTSLTNRVKALEAKIIYSSTQPTGVKGYIWLKPST